MEEIIVVIVLILLLFADKPTLVPQNNSILTGHMYMVELMDTESERRFLTACRMSKPTFVSLVQFLKEKGRLVDGRKLKAEEKIMILLHVLAGLSVAQTAERFQHSKSKSTPGSQFWEICLRSHFQSKLCWYSAFSVFTIG